MSVESHTEQSQEAPAGKQDHAVRASVPKLASWQHSANLDFLRTFAVLCVVFRHMAGYIGIHDRGPYHLQPLGIFGVLLFFVHTCLVLMASMERMRSGHVLKDSDFAIAFWIRRIFRLYPLSLLTVTIAATVFITPARTVVLNLLLVQPFVHAISIPGALWSLPFELLMYVFLPGIYLWTLGRGPKPVIVLWPFLFAVIFIRNRVTFIPYFFSFTSCFMGGVIAYLCKRRPVLPAVVLPIFLVVAAVLDVVIYGIIHDWVAAGAPFCLILGLMLPRLHEISWKPVVRTCSVVAKYSYGVYLFHMIALDVFFNDQNPRWHIDLPFAPLGTAAIALTATFLLSMLTYWAIESPMISVGARISLSFLRRRQAAA